MDLGWNTGNWAGMEVICTEFKLWHGALGAWEWAHGQA